MDPSKGRPVEKKQGELPREEVDRRQSRYSCTLPTISSGLLLSEDVNDSSSDTESNGETGFEDQTLRASPAVTDLTAPAVETVPGSNISRRSPRRKPDKASTAIDEIVRGISTLNINDLPIQPGPSNRPDTVALASLHRRHAVTDLTRALLPAPSADDIAKDVVTSEEQTDTDSTPSVTSFPIILERDNGDETDETDNPEDEKEPNHVVMANEPNVMEMAHGPEEVVVANEPDNAEVANEPNSEEVANVQ